MEEQGLSFIQYRSLTDDEDVLTIPLGDNWTTPIIFHPKEGNNSIMMHFQTSTKN